MANTRLTRTPSSASNRKTFTISLWFKIGRHPFTEGGGGDSRELIGQTSSSYFRCILKSDETMRIYDQSGFNFITNRKFRDKSGYYHLVIRVDTTQSTANDRVRVYINGVDERTVGAYSTDTAPSQNQDLAWNTTSVHQIGGHSNNYDYFSGVISHIHHCDGQSYAPTAFGSVDNVNGEWKINTSPSVTYGTNGFFILKDGNSVTDQSGNSNNWTVASGTLTKTEDCPSNVFATFNPLFTQQAPTTTNMGNTRIDQSSSAWRSSLTTIGASSGKYYAEFKVGTISSSSPYKFNQIGVVNEDIIKGSASDFIYVGYNNYGWGLNWNGDLYHNDSNLSGSFSSFTTGDIICVAMDLDNFKAYWRKNNSAWMNSGDPTSGSTGTGAISLDTGKTYFFAASVYGNECFANYGNGFFGTQQVSSAGTNASGNGIFEYDVPNGFTALSTKGLNL